MINVAKITLLVVLVLLSSPANTKNVEQKEKVDFLIINGVIYDGLGTPPMPGGVAISGDKIVGVGDISTFVSDTVLDANGQAIAPGFINMLSWGVQSLLYDGRGLSDIKQGVTLEVFGEGLSMGPISPLLKKELEKNFSVYKPFKVRWQSLGDYLEYMVDKGVSPNIASFVGATTLRINHIGLEDRKATPEEIRAMQNSVRLAMEEGAMGVGSALIYPPGLYADTEELIALAAAAAPYGGSYISHMRSESSGLMESVEELITISKKSGAPAEIYHLKAAGIGNWAKMAKVIDRVNIAREEGLDIRANMYTYTAGETGLDVTMPPWVQEGTYEDWRRRLKDPALRAKVKAEMKEPNGWESLWVEAGSPDKLMFSTFKNPDLQKYTGRTLKQVMDDRGTDAEDTMIDLVIEDGSRVGTIYFLMSEENMALKAQTSWVSFGSDGEVLAPEGAFLKFNPHPRGYGNFSRFFSEYVRDKGLLSLEEAVRRMTSLPAANLALKGRGQLRIGYSADIVLFDPDKIQDHATFSNPHQLSTGVSHVFVNGIQVLKNGHHTGAKPGQVVRGPGWTGWSKGSD